MFDQVLEVAAQQRLAAGDADLLDALVDEDFRDAHDLLEGQQLLARQEGVIVVEDFLRHAIHAAEIAAVGDRDAQVAHAAAAPVDQLALGRRGEVAARRQRGPDHSGDGDDAGVVHGRTISRARLADKSGAKVQASSEARSKPVSAACSGVGEMPLSSSLRPVRWSGDWFSESMAISRPALK
jgi:hypothetical protein